MTQHTPGKIRLNNVRLSFPHLFAPETFGGDGELKFSANFILEPTHPQLQEVRNMIASAAREKWGAKADVMLQQLQAKGHTCLTDGAMKAAYEGYAGSWYVAARSSRRPTLIGADKAPLAQEDGQLYSGCFVNAVVRIWVQDNKYGRRVNAELAGVQFHADGEAFGGGAPADVDDFDNVEDSTGATWPADPLATQPATPSSDPLGGLV